MRVVLLHDHIHADSPPDVRDVVEQRDHVGKALAACGHAVSALAIDPDLDALSRRLEKCRPELIFNLVESVGGDSRLAPVVTALFDHLRIPYTGAKTRSLLLTSDKVRTKRWLVSHGIDTPAWEAGTPAPSLHPWVGGWVGPWIVKPVREDASVGIDDGSVVNLAHEIPPLIAERRARWGGDWFAEQFIAGREINVGVLAGLRGPVVLPVAEIEFIDFPPGKPQIVGYDAKWSADSFESMHTRRRFIEGNAEVDLCRSVQAVALRCWEVFGLRGYGRIDFRVDDDGRPWVLEVNANPCIAPDAGYCAALRMAGIGFEDAMAAIVDDASPGAREGQYRGAGSAN